MIDMLEAGLVLDLRWNHVMALRMHLAGTRRHLLLVIVFIGPLSCKIRRSLVLVRLAVLCPC
jgi:hypothetical protein